MSAVRRDPVSKLFSRTPSTSTHQRGLPVHSPPQKPAETSGKDTKMLRVRIVFRYWHDALCRI